MGEAVAVRLHFYRICISAYSGRRIRKDPGQERRGAGGEHSRKGDGGAVVMKYLVSASEMKQYDKNTIEKIGIPACVLMERAALAAAEAVEERCAGIQGRRDVLVMAGTGNNGGDGLAMARLLSEKGYNVEVWCVGERQKATEQWKQQMEILKKYPVILTQEPARQEYTVMVDALFGVGLGREIQGCYREAVETFQRRNGWKLALDLPSGVDSDTGRIWGCGVRADMTVTFGFCKRGLALYPGCEFAGEVRTADIGISERSFFGAEPVMYAFDESVAELMPGRKKDGNKGSFGKILLVAGSENMAGAAVLAARAAYRSGAGMVKIVTPEINRIILQCTVPEALLSVPENLAEDMEWADVVAMGPGAGQYGTAFSCLEQVIREGEKPLLLDADGLNLLAAHPKWREILAGQGKDGRKIVLTPHVGELSRLVGKSVAECKQDLPAIGKGLAEELHAVVAAKDARTFICGEKGGICVNLSGNSGMATAGSGDVLAGVIASFLAQGMDAFRAAAVGAYVHGRAGDAAAAIKGQYACMAGDIAEHIGI